MTYFGYEIPPGLTWNGSAWTPNADIKDGKCQEDKKKPKTYKNVENKKKSTKM